MLQLKLIDAKIACEYVPTLRFGHFSKFKVTLKKGIQYFIKDKYLSNYIFLAGVSHVSLLTVPLALTTIDMENIFKQRSLAYRIKIHLNKQANLFFLNSRRFLSYANDLFIMLNYVKTVVNIFKSIVCLRIEFSIRIVLKLNVMKTRKK